MGDWRVKQLSRMMFVYLDRNRREVGRSKIEQDVLGAPQAVGGPASQKHLACSSNALGPADRAGSVVSTGGSGVWLANPQAGAVCAAEEAAAG